ncbi:hypothetical protein ACF09J_32505 [Streptomyces sp. NPDC014889]|uniref:hypothetical protein n=1 Tax=Streptomyces sp. NPDC014889 TaxID=3364928 RepID=UPI0036F6F5AE
MRGPGLIRRLAHPAEPKRPRTRGHIVRACGTRKTLIALRAAEKPQAAHLIPGATKVWAPPRIQQMPGESCCTVGNALDPAPAPH